jgi:hypothetical protein
MKTTETPSAASDRRSFLKGAGMAGIGLAGAGLIASKLASPLQKVEAQGITDGDILNFALNLEYLEAEYYCMATLGKTLVQLGIISASDETGPTTGGALISALASTAPESYLATALRSNEVDHVTLLRNALGTSAVKKPAINLDALGYGFADVNDFLKHSGALRLACIMNGVDSPAVDASDIPPDSLHPFAAPIEGLTKARTTSKVLAIVYGGGKSSGGFYPDGLNGTITSQS